MLQLVCYARRVLTLEELCVASAHASAREDFVIIQVSACEIQKFERRILATAGGLLETFRKCLRTNDPASESKSIEEGPKHQKIYVNVIHRIVRTYLDSDEWTQILDTKHEGVFHSQVLWLRVCNRMFPPSFRIPPPNDNNKMLRRRISTKPIPPDFSLSEVQQSSTNSVGFQEHHGLMMESPLLEYAALYLLQHAEKVEENLGLSTYAILQPGFSDIYVLYHRYAWTRRDSTCMCFYNNLEPLHPLHPAMIHGLEGFVRDFLSLFCKINVRGSLKWDEVFYLDIDEHTSDQSLACNPSPGWKSLLEFSLSYEQHPYKNFSQIPIIAILLKYCTPVCDAAMVSALKESSPQTVRLLLAQWPERKFVLTSNELRDSWYANGIPCAGLDCGPLWYIARRERDLHPGRQAELLELFLQRGEDINGQCGPLGTALHSALGHLPDKSSNFGLCELMVAKGADVNQDGPLGTPLEFVWRLANTVKMFKSRHVSNFVQAIHWLIASGAENKRLDPNGFIPIQEQMLAFSLSTRNGEVNMDAYRESLTFYKGMTYNLET